MTDNIDAKRLKKIRQIIEDSPIELWDVDDPIDYAKNNKEHTQESVAKLAASMKQLGQINPIIVDTNGVIISGHGRRQAAKYLNWQKIQVRVVKVSEKTAREMRLADNLTSNQKYNHDVIGEELREILSGGVSLDDLADSVGLDQKLKDFILPDLSGAFDRINKDAISDDLIEDIANFETERERVMDEIEDEPQPIHQALGFKKAKPSQIRTIRAFIVQVQEETGIEDPAEALVKWIEEIQE